MEKITELKKATAAPDLWDDPDNARTLLKELTRLENIVEKIEGLESQVEDVELYEEMAEMEEPGAREEFFTQFEKLEEDIKDEETATLLSGQYDTSDAILTIHSGAGGTEAQDWADMLLRMYLRWMDRKEFNYKIVEQSPGEEAGIKSATIMVEGDYAYGLLRNEGGVHRLVRLSPFDSAHRRHTSFAQVEVMPQIEEDIEVEINDEDLKIDTYRASGAGGQHVNKTSSAVRITHLPTKIVVQCQNERSQHSNKNTAMKILKAKLVEMKLQEQEKKLAELRGEHMDIGWGSQIRSYVLHPYSLVKDHRTNTEVGNVQGVLDGDIDVFIRNYLEHKAEIQARIR